MLFELTLKYSGIIAVLGVWFLLVLPSHIAKYDHKKLPASYAGDINKVKNYFNPGLLIVGTSQFLFFIYIYQKFPSFNLFIPLMLGFIGAISLIVSAHLTFKKHNHFHQFQLFKLCPKLSAFIADNFGQTEIPQSHSMAIINN